jgi:hypothetical protein
MRRDCSQARYPLACQCLSRCQLSRFGRSWHLGNLLPNFTGGKGRAVLRLFRPHGLAVCLVGRNGRAFPSGAPRSGNPSGVKVPTASRCGGIFGGELDSIINVLCRHDDDASKGSVL